MNKNIRLSLKVFKIVLICFVVLFFAVYIYVTVNKKQLVEQVTQQISEKLNGDVKIETADISFFKSFPKVAVLVSNIKITDTMYDRHKHAFFEAKELFVNINVFKLLGKSSPLSGIRVKQGSIFLYTDTAGYSNQYLLKSKKEPTGGPKKTTKDISLNNILLQQMQFVLLDEKREKYHDFVIDELKVSLADEADDLVMDTRVDMLVKSLAFNVPKGTFLKNAGFAGRFEIRYGKKSQVLSFANISVKLSGHPYNLTGTFDLGEKNPGFTLKVKTEDAIYDNVKKLLPGRIDTSLSIVSVSSPLSAEADLYGPLRGGEPYILVRWVVKDATLKTNFMDFDHAYFTGYYKNEVQAGLPRKDPNSVISLSDFKGDWHGLKITSGDIEILDLQKPVLTCDLHSAFPLKDLNELLQTQSLQLTAGDADVQLTYKGPVERNNNTNSFLNGAINISKGKVLYTPRNVEMTELNGKLTFKNSNVALENLHCKVLGNDIVMNGIANNVLTLISTEPNKVSIDYNIYSPQLNLASFTYLLQSPKKAAAKSGKSFNSMASKIDELLEKSRIQVELKTDRLLYKKLDASKLDASITVLQDRYVLNRVNMGLAEGAMQMSGQLVNVQSGRHQASLKAAMQNVNVQKVFYAFENFGQDGITDKNLKGKLTVDADVKIDIDSEGKVLPSSSLGEVNFSLKKGALNNFEPIKKIQKFIFKNRDFETIEFAELKNRLSINRGEITIPRMEIQSSVLSFFVEGLYSSRGNTDVSVQVPFNNLKKRDDDYIPENIGVDKKGGRSIFLRGQPGKDGNVQFKVDLFKRFQKEKEKEK